MKLHKQTNPEEDEVEFKDIEKSAREELKEKFFDDLNYVGIVKIKFEREEYCIYEV